MKEALFYEENFYGKPKGFFRKQVTPGSRIWKIIQNGHEISYEWVGFEKDRITPVFKRIKTTGEELLEGMVELNKTISSLPS